MDDDKRINKSIVKRIAAVLQRDERAVVSALSIIYGAIPHWIPAQSINRAKRTIDKLLKDGHSANDIQQRVAEAERDALIVPGIVTDPSAFAQSVYELVHIRYAISLGKSKGLRELAGDKAELGQRFSDGRKQGSRGPIRKAIERLLAGNPELKNPELWESIKDNPPRGWQAYENSLGKYLEGPKNKNMGYRRFCNVCRDERKEVKQKITV